MKRETNLSHLSFHWIPASPGMTKKDKQQSFPCTTAGTQEVEQRREQLPKRESSYKKINLSLYDRTQ